MLRSFIKRLAELEELEKKEVAVITQGDEESQEQALERHFSEHPEDRHAKLNVLIRNFDYEAKYGLLPEAKGVVQLPN